MDMFNGQGRGAELSSAKDTAYGLLCSITEFADHERRAMSTDHRLDSAWFGAGAGLKQRGLEQALCFDSLSSCNSPTLTPQVLKQMLSHSTHVTLSTHITTTI